jgi:tetratricopeptide (TPR) repeat protein
VLLDQSKVEQAAAAIERALALKPHDHDAINWLGRVAFARGDLVGAVAHYKRALALKGDLADAWNNMGKTLRELGRLDEAQQAFLRAIALDPNNTGV